MFDEAFDGVFFKQVFTSVTAPPTCPISREAMIRSIPPVFGHFLNYTMALYGVQGVPSTMAEYPIEKILTNVRRNPSIYGSLSSSPRSTFVVQLTPMLLHNNSLFTASDDQPPAGRFGADFKTNIFLPLQES